MKKLAIAQIVLGVLVVGSLVFWTGWVSLGYHRREGILPDGTIFRISGLIAPNPSLDAWTIIYLVLGLSVFGCGIAQFLKARRSKTAEEDKLESGDENRAVKA